jgi:membrane-associated protease RseP (regulator of RpoE activity)
LTDSTRATIADSTSDATRDHAEHYDAYRRRRRERLGLPIFLFVATCFSTFWVGITHWDPTAPITTLMAEGSDAFGMQARQMVVENWSQGLIYTACVLAILLVHELGHFVATIIYKVPATAPIFLPFPFNPIGTLGAIIAMQSMVANRKQIFDIGIAGPLAGLIVAIPIAIVGINQLDVSATGTGSLGFECPLLFSWLINWIGVEGYSSGDPIWINQLNPYFAAAWVGFLITGLNMFPVGQLDGGHVTYTLFGKFSYLLANGTVVLAIAFMVFNNSYVLVLMVVLLLMMGTRHPPTADDNVKLGPFRIALGLASLSIPILCFPPRIFELSL